MKTYYVRLWCSQINQYARFVVQSETATKAGSHAQAYITDGKRWTVDGVKLIDFEHTNIIEV